MALEDDGNPFVALSLLVVELKQELVHVLEGKQISLEQASFGFHIPPFTTVKHLHMHAIAPVSKMGFVGRMIFRPNTMWFKTVQGDPILDQPFLQLICHSTSLIFFLVSG